MNDLIANLLGLLGLGLILYSFYQTAKGRWNGRSLSFELNNLFGALALTYYSVEKQAYLNLLLNLIWAGMALYGTLFIADRHRAE